MYPYFNKKEKLYLLSFFLNKIFYIWQNSSVPDNFTNTLKISFFYQSLPILMENISVFFAMDRTALDFLGKKDWIFTQLIKLKVKEN